MQWVLAATPHIDRVDYKKLAAALGVNRRSLRSVSPGDVERELGFQVGGIGPFALRDGVQVVFDEACSDLGKVFCGAGINTVTLEIDVADLIRLSAAIVAPIRRA